MSPSRRCASRASLAAVVALSLAAGRLSAATPPTPTVPSSYATLPATPPSPTGSQTDFSEYAWKLFVAVNWPAKAGVRGVPDPTVKFGAPGVPVVWETYKTTPQLFLANAANPGPWNSGASSGTGAATAPRPLKYRAKAPAELRLPTSIAQAVGGWLIDVKSNPTYYEIAVNETSYNYVLNNQYYNATILNSASKVDFPSGALEVKAAWRILDGEDTSRFHTVQADVALFDANGNPTGQTAKKTVGLVGLHVVYKATGFPQWIWATFEQVDNAPDAAAAAGTKQKWSYFDPNCSGNFCTPNTSPQQSGAPFGTPNPITRVSPIRPDTVTVNTKWQKTVAGTPWQYYQLISPQWPSDPGDPGNPQGSPTPGTVANTVLESYIQPTSSCMDCHSTARVQNNSIKTNYSFIFLAAQSPATSTTTAPATSTPKKQ